LAGESGLVADNSIRASRSRRIAEQRHRGLPRWVVRSAQRIGRGILRIRQMASDRQALHRISSSDSPVGIATPVPLDPE
jgi:hypothetical protein